jgi:hypothetical protein
VASGQSSLEAFRVGIGVASALVIIGGQLAGAPLDAAGLHAAG